MNGEQPLGEAAQRLTPRVGSRYNVRVDVVSAGARVSYGGQP
jgi:hypothetical protein